MGCTHPSSADQLTAEQARVPEETPSDSTTLSEPRYTYHEFDMIFVFYKTKDLAIYRKLLPRQFQMPADPLVMMLVADYYKMDKATQPYQEAAMFVLVDYEGKPAWHCVTMPVTSDEARHGGIYYLGYPKIMGDITLQRSADQFSGVLKLNHKMILSVDLKTKNHQISSEERQFFERFKAVPSLNIKDGQVFEPKFGDSTGQYTLLQLAEMYPDKLEVKVGKADLVIDAAAAANYSERLGAIFSIRPSEMVLAYYLKSKFVTGFRN
jgi:hypothetical protein